MKKSSKKNKRVSKTPKKKVLKKTTRGLWDFKDFLSMKEVDGADLDALFKLADKMKKKPESFYGKLKGRSLAMLRP